MKRRSFHFPPLLGLALALLAGLFTGCQSPDAPGSNSLASVVIRNTTADAVRAATVAVFEGQAWASMGERQGVLTFEREGTRRDNRLYGGWAGFDSAVWMIAEVRLQPYGDGQLLRCDAVAVINQGDPINEIRRPPRPISAGPYQDLLEEVKKRCANQP